MRTILVAALLVALSVAEEPPEPQEAPAAVEMDQSFRISQAKGDGISHTPSVVFTKDGKRALTATSDGQVVVFDAATRKVLRRVKLPDAGTDGVAIDPAGRFVAWVLEKGGVAVLEIATGKVVARDEAAKAAWLAIAPDASRIALAAGASVEVRSLATLKPAGAPVTGEADVTNLVWSADGARLGWTAADGRVVVRDVRKSRTVHETKKAVPMYALAFAPGGGRVAYGGQDNTVYQYDFAKETEDVIAQGQPFWITCLGYSPDGTRIAVGDESCDIWLFDVAKKEKLFHNKHHVECWLSCVAWAPDNRTFLFGCRPNSHAGRPHLHAPLSLAEAARSQAARASRTRLLAALDAEIAKAGNKERKAELEGYRTRIANEERVVPTDAFGLTESYGYAMGAIGIAGGASGGSGAPADGGISDSPIPEINVPPALALDKLPEGLRKLAESHRATLDQEMKKLQADFCINQWKVK